MQRYIKIISILLIGLFMTTGCSEDYLELRPTTDVAAATATETTANLFLVVNGIHRLMYSRQGSNGRGGYSAMLIQNDCLGEDLVHNARANGWWINMARWNDHTNAVDTDLRHAWRVLYQVINNANIIIDGAADAVGPDEERNAALGQALAYRGFAHFRMVQLYGIRYDAGGNNTQLGIPLSLTSSPDPRARATVEEVYAQVNDDLDRAIELLNGYERPNSSHINQQVARGMKARVNLVQGNWQVAADFAALAMDGHPLMDRETYRQGFNDYSNTEWMWGGFYNEEQGSTFTNFGAWMSRNFSSSNIRGNPKSISMTLYDQIPTTDVRSTIFDPTGEHNDLPAGIEISSRHSRFPYTSQKFLAFATGDSRGDVPYMRGAEMYLIQAEALARLSNDTDAQTALSILAEARDPDYAASNTGDALIDEILLQRRWELWGEGFRFNDLKRLNQNLDRTGSNHNASLLSNLLEVSAGDSRWQWLIPMAEMDANPLMVQNP